MRYRATQKRRLVCDSVSVRLHRIESSTRKTLPGRVTLFLAVALSVMALVQSVHRARQGRSALLKWRPDVEAVLAGETVYGRDAQTLDEGFPTLPLTALVLAPFLKSPDASARSTSVASSAWSRWAATSTPCRSPASPTACTKWSIPR